MRSSSSFNRDLARGVKRGGAHSSHILEERRVRARARSVSASGTSASSRVSNTVNACEQSQSAEAPEPWVAARDCEAPTLLLQAPARAEQDTQQGSARATMVAEIHDEARTSHLDREVDAPGHARRRVSFSTSDQHGSLRRASYRRGARSRQGCTHSEFGRNRLTVRETCIAHTDRCPDRNRRARVSSSPTTTERPFELRLRHLRAPTNLPILRFFVELLARAASGRLAMAPDPSTATGRDVFLDSRDEVVACRFALVPC